MQAIATHFSILRTLAITSICSLLATTIANAGVVVTQVEDRAFFSLWLLSQHIQQDIAHNLIIDNHDIVVVPEFTAETLAGADVVYVSPAYDELQITQAEIEALEQFVIDGGRLIIPGDYGMWVAELAPIAEHFGSRPFRTTVPRCRTRGSWWRQGRSIDRARRGTGPRGRRCRRIRSRSARPPPSPSWPAHLLSFLRHRLGRCFVSLMTPSWSN